MSSYGYIDSLGDDRVKRNSQLLHERIRCLKRLGRGPQIEETMRQLKALDDDYGDYDILQAGQYLNARRYTEAKRHIRLAYQKPRAHRLQLEVLECAADMGLGD